MIGNRGACFFDIMDSFETPHELVREEAAGSINGRRRLLSKKEGIYGIENLMVVCYTIL